MLKLHKKTLLLVAAGIFTIAAAYLGTENSKRLDEKAGLEQRLAAAQDNLRRIRLEPLATQSSDMERQLNSIAPQVESVRVKLSQNVTSTAAASAIFDAAGIYDLTVGQLASTSPAEEKLGGLTLSAMSLTAEIYGNASDIVGFIRALNNLLKTGAIKSIEMTIPETGSNEATSQVGDNTGARAGDNTTARIELTVYTYGGNQ